MRDAAAYRERRLDIRRIQVSACGAWENRNLFGGEQLRVTAPILKTRSR
ncbi:MAG: hypothetical protein ACLSHC_15150 [Bilophila wadsworthia]